MRIGKIGKEFLQTKKNLLHVLENNPDVQEIIKFVIDLFWNRLAWFMGLSAFSLTMLCFIINPLIISLYL